MKRIITILIFSISFHVVNAQFGENNAIYLTNELNFGNYIGFNINLNYVYKEKYSFKIESTANLRKSKPQPKDYRYGFLNRLFFGLGSDFDQFNNF